MLLSIVAPFLFFFFFFQAEDGIRDLYVTGVQTCALPISTIINRLLASSMDSRETSSNFPPNPIFGARHAKSSREPPVMVTRKARMNIRSEERRVGKECRSRWSQDH